MKDEFITGDPWIAAQFAYNGCPCIKVEGFGNKDTTYTFRVKEMDAAIIQEEFMNNVAVYVTDWIRALKSVQSLQKLSKERGGVYTSLEYAQVRQ